MSASPSITTHVLDLSRGRPASGVPVVLSKRDGAAWKELGRGTTDLDGRVKALLPEGTPIVEGTYLLAFDTHTYFRVQGVIGFYPEVTVVFEVMDARGHYHVPLLLSSFGYSTYRGS
ncbi:MAG TPA: hydroxyisourate hydrolase [Thermoanaerobaculia bacterium]|jgi:5-hydroxyisourate hydrolase|nr:hydroxyisourate hydrolase [Thermoanaerobaculia bacterium]